MGCMHCDGPQGCCGRVVRPVQEGDAPHVRQEPAAAALVHFVSLQHKFIPSTAAPLAHVDVEPAARRLHGGGRHAEARRHQLGLEMVARQHRRVPGGMGRIAARGQAGNARIVVGLVEECGRVPRVGPVGQPCRRQHAVDRGLPACTRISDDGRIACRRRSLVHCAIRSPRLMSSACGDGWTSRQRPSGATICSPGTASACSTVRIP